MQVQKGQIIRQFKRNGFNIDSNCLRIVLQYLGLSTNQQKSLKTLIKKVNELAITSQQKFGQQTVKIAIQILTMGTDGKFNTLQQIIEDLRKWSIMYISPYQRSELRFFIQQPEPYLFKFDPNEVMKSDIRRFKQVESATREQLKSNEWFIGMFYQDFSKLMTTQDGTGAKLILQNQANELEIVFPKDYKHKIPLVSGCIYAARGEFLQRNLVLTVKQLVLPSPLSEEKCCLMRLKFKRMCGNIHSSKSSLIFQSKDFYKYSTIYNEERNSNNMTLIFGSVKVNKICVERIYKIFTQMGQSNCKVECLVLMLDDENSHEDIDLKLWFKGVAIFVIPHANSDGPRLLPKIPIIKNNFNVTKVLTNPAKFSIYGKQVMFMNLPLMKNMYEKNLLSSKQTLSSSSSLNPDQMAKSLSQLLFSQSSAHIVSDIFPMQIDYFKLRQQTILFLSDKACRQLEHSKDGKKCQFVSVGNFYKQGKFVCYMPRHKKSVQLSEQF